MKIEGLYYNFDQRQNTSGLTFDSDPDDFAQLDNILLARVGVNYSLTPRESFPTSSSYSSSLLNWRGFYGGATLGYGLVGFDSVHEADDRDDAIDHDDSVLGRFLNLDGGLFGGHLGYNMMFGRYVAGVEFDLQKINSSDLRYDPDSGDPFDTRDYAGVEIDWIASLRSRFGITSGRSIFYTTAGVAWARGEYFAFDDACFCGDSSGSVSLNQTGFVFGAGLEHAVANNFLLRFEALHYAFGKRFDTRNLTLDSSVGDFAQLDDISVARIGVSYKLNVE